MATLVAENVTQDVIYLSFATAIMATLVAGQGSLRKEWRWCAAVC